MTSPHTHQIRKKKREKWKTINTQPKGKKKWPSLQRIAIWHFSMKNWHFWVKQIPSMQMVLCGKTNYLTAPPPPPSCFPALFSEDRSWIKWTKLQGPTAEDLCSRKQIWDTDFHENSNIHVLGIVLPETLPADLPPPVARTQVLRWLVEESGPSRRCLLEEQGASCAFPKPWAPGTSQGLAQLWLVLTPLTLFVWWASMLHLQERFSCNPQSQAQSELILNSIPSSFP